MNLGHLPGVRDWLKRSGIPAVNTGGDLKKVKGVISVFTDPKSIVTLAVQHFIEKDLRHFAFVGDKRSDVTNEIRQEMTEQLGEHGFDLDTFAAETLFLGTFEDFDSLDEVEPGLVRLIQAARKPLGLLAQTDRMAAAVCRVAQLLGLKIPEDVSVVGVHDTAMARLFTPPISSVRPSHEAIGYEAARLLHRKLCGERLAKRSVMLAAESLVERGSSNHKIGTSLDRTRVTDSYIHEALHYIHTRTCEGIGIKDVATHVNMPMRTFQSEFASAVGHPVGEEIRRTRLTHILKLLDTTELPLDAIARLVGLANAASLIRIVSKETGVSPTEYRRQIHDKGY